MVFYHETKQFIFIFGETGITEFFAQIETARIWSEMFILQKNDIQGLDRNKVRRMLLTFWTETDSIRQNCFVLFQFFALEIWN